jgi:hypothetical protein
VLEDEVAVDVGAEASASGLVDAHRRVAFVEPR